MKIYKLQGIYAHKDLYDNKWKISDLDKVEKKEKSEVLLNSVYRQELVNLLYNKNNSSSPITELIKFEEENVERMYKFIKQELRKAENKDKIFFINILPITFLNSYKIWDILDKFDDIKDNVVIEITENGIWLWFTFWFSHYDKMIIDIIKNYDQLTFAIDWVWFRDSMDKGIHTMKKLEKVIAQKDKIKNLKYIKINRKFLEKYKEITDPKGQKEISDCFFDFTLKNPEINIIFKWIETVQEENLFKYSLFSLNNNNVFFNDLSITNNIIKKGL